MALIGKKIAGGNAASHAITAAFDTTGSTLFVAGTVDYEANAPGVMTDSAGNTWNSSLSSYSVAGPGQRLKIYYCLSPTTNASHTFNFGASPTVTYPALSILAFSGFTAKDLDEGRTNAGSGTSNFLTTGAGITPTEDGELLVYFVAGDILTPTGISVGTLQDEQSNFASVSFGLASAYYVQPTAANFVPYFTWSGPATYASTAIVTFKVAASANTTRSYCFVSG